MPRIVPYYCLFPQNGKWQILQCLIWAIYDIQTSYGCLKVSEFYQESDSEDSGEEQWVNFFNAYLPFQPSIPTAAISLIPCQTFEDFCLPFKWAAHMAAVTPSPTKCQLQLWILFNIKLKVHVTGRYPVVPRYEIVKSGQTLLLTAIIPGCGCNI